MKQSIRAKRLARKHKRQVKQSKLNLVSLMDIFTILVFFLLVNSSDVEVLQSDKTIKLPDSIAEQKPETTLVVRVNNETLFVGNREIAEISTLNDGKETIAALTTELNYQAERAGPLAEDDISKGRAVTIMGDVSVPYQLLKRIMATCSLNNYRNISLAVNQVPSDSNITADIGTGGANE